MTKMIHFLLDSGAINATFWFALALGLVSLMSSRRKLGRGCTILLATLLAVGTLGNVCLALYRAYTVPRDILQDVVSAQEYLAGRPLYPADMTKRINAALKEEGQRHSLLVRWPDLRRREQEHIHDSLSSHWVQAHPPFMTLFTAPFVKVFSIVGTQIAFVMIAIAAMLTTLLLIRHELFPEMAGSTFALVTLALCGWDPVLTVLRSEQSGLLLGCLLTISWYLLRHRRPGWAGLATGIAVSLKLIPGLILLVFLMRHRRSFGSAILTIIAIGLFGLLATSWQDHIDYWKTSQEVAAEYAAYSGNISLLATLARGSRDLGSGLSIARAIWLACALVFIVCFAWMLRKPAFVNADIDLEFAIAMTLMPLLSPISWDHYLTFLILPMSVLASRLVRGESQGKMLGFVGLLILFAIPQTGYDWISILGTSSEWHRFVIWFVLPIRMMGLLILTIELAREMGRRHATAVVRT
ncbi:MAG: DUF2029 domain-containing protein [Planctomycetes bacterium]|nr:DUF2029 domain-containing protein [Planctomycetota bacterium]